MFLSSENTYLRALEPTDLEFLYALENDTSVWHIGNTLTPYSRATLETYLENATLDIYTVKQLRLVICNQADEAVGAIDLFDFDPLHQRAGVGVVVTAAHRGHGHAGDAHRHGHQPRQHQPLPESGVRESRHPEGVAADARRLAGCGGVSAGVLAAVRHQAGIYA